MSNTREQGKIPPPPLDEDGNLIVVEDGSNTETSTAPSLEELMRRLEEFRAENKKLKAKAKNKKTKGSSSSSEEEDSSFEEDVFKKEKKGRRNHDKPFYNSMSFNYNNMPSSTAYIYILIGKAQYFDGTSYNQWNHCLKNYLYSISPEVWQVVCDGLDFPDDDDQPTPDQLQKIHRNAQAISILTSYNHVDILDVAKDVWTTLWMAHEGSKPVRKAKVEMFEGQLNRFVMYNDETPHGMLNRLKKLGNKARALGSKKWTDHMLTERLMMAYTPMNYNVVALIHQNPA
jgi:hypothetical protein